MSPPLEVRLLGEIEVARGGKAMPLPASKKTRALLGYLIVAGTRPQPRQRLCELFWDGPDDPRAALRWSLSKLRPLVDDAKAARIVADREHVAFEPRGAIVDLFLMREDAASIAVAPIDTLRAAAARFRGELLEGLDLPECYRYHEWCIAEREAARKVRTVVLATLAQRLAAQPEEALGFARARVTIDPLSEAGHVAVMQLLSTLGRPREALRQYERCRRILEAQLGRTPSKELEAARSALGQMSASLPPPEAPAHEIARPAQRSPLVGRSAESAAVADAVAEARAGTSRRVLLFVGEPGIGKTRLLEEVADQVTAAGGSALSGRAFEAEMVRPYGAWIEALRSAALGSIDAGLRADLGALLPELGTPPGGIDRNRLFDAVTKLLARRAESAPLAVVLDDLQWFDESSLALLNYASRRAEGSRVLFACAARTTEIDGNPRAMAFVRATQREGRLARTDLRPLDADATADLVRGVDDRADAARVFAEGGGNPLFSIELARAFMEGGDDTLHTLDGVIAERLSRLGDRAADLLPWVSALGNAFSVDTLAALASLPSGDLLAALDDLERHGVLRAKSDNGLTGYDFAHDLVRQAAYRAMSEPRRRWVHLQIARTLQAAGDPEGALAGDVAHHAALGGDNELAARAYVAAGERCLRLFAHADASKLAASGLQHVDHLPIDVAIGIRLALLGVQVLSNQWLRRSHELEAELSRVADAAKDRGMHAEVARAFYLTSFVHNERGDAARTGASTLQAAHAVRAADVETRQQQLANTGRCLALIERDVAHAEELLRESQALGPSMTERTSFEMAFGLGLVSAFKGQNVEATSLLERAVDLAAAHADHWSQSQALTRLATLALDSARPRDALVRCLAVEPLVAKLSEGSEGPLVAALQALARLELGEEGALSAVEASLSSLKVIDSKAHLAYVLDVVAAHDVRAGRTGDACRRAEQALVLAEAVGHKSEAAIARSILAGLALDRGDRAAALAILRACEPDLMTPLGISARAGLAVSAVARRAGVALPAPRPT